MSNDPLRFRKNLSEIISKLIMTIDDNTKDEKFLHDINREAAKISVLSSGKIDMNILQVKKYQRQITEQAKFATFVVKNYNQLKEFFQKKCEIMKLKMKWMKLKNEKIKLNEKY